ncbi:probable linoleate 9S-lipoxygenase 5 isoform X2 [Salvia hispanica]|uniref:probable linoleate 9S-lipoxygenase 5 isoform X2 n=1 Tax=Salvia hispanica TaxID=49212 RepID=UPI0020095FBF|nr:probable linoleate 9S-lipoxygenase 5 isoform X2 [Salvia hispanica]
MLNGIVNALNGNGKHHEEVKKIKGRVVLTRKSVLDFNDVGASLLDRLHELVGQTVTLHLISSVHSDSEGNKGKVGKGAELERWITKIPSLKPEDSAYEVTFDHEIDIGIPGAFLIKNNHHSEFFLKTLTLEGVPGHEHAPMHFVCNSWVYPSDKYKSDRIFFANQAYLPSQTPPPLLAYREEELLVLRGDGTGELKEWDRVYDYAYYNDLGDPDRGEDSARPVLGGSSQYPYPRRGRTGRPPTRTDPNTESRIPLIMSLNIYVPRDERFGHLKMSDFLGYGLKSVFQFLLPVLTDLCATLSNEFESFEDVLKIYEEGFKLPEGALLQNIYDNVPMELLNDVFHRDAKGFFKYPMPDIIKESKTAWRTDEEFTKEMVAGMNPVIISRLQEFPPKSNLDTQLYGNQGSKITWDHIKNGVDGLTLEEALETNRLFILNHHDSLMPYLRRINTTTTKMYATRTVLFLQNDGSLRPLAIELSLPHPDGDEHGAVSQVYTPAQDGVEGSIWQLAKAFVGVSDSGVHQLISHWLNTHAAIEPVVIATNRQLSVMHPIHKLLYPHFRDTMNINAFARQILINAGGILEATVFPGRYAMELSSFIYKDWNFADQALPADLLKRGMAVEDPNSPHGIRLVMEDYPYAVDGLQIWSAISTWVNDYCNLYYPSDEAVKGDTELQSWWKELREEGHGDKKDAPWWPKMQTRKDLIDSCTIIIWIASALHAALNFGQYPYAGYMPNRPTVSRQFMPEPGSKDYELLKTDPDKVFLKTITARLQTLLGVALIEILSRHTSDEIYLGQRDTPVWTKDEEALAAFERFGKELGGVERNIMEMNGDEKWKNRVGPAKLPYTLLYPTSDEGLTGRGIPNSTSI